MRFAILVVDRPHPSFFISVVWIAQCVQRAGRRSVGLPTNGGEITQLLRRMSGGDAAAADELYRTLHGDLHRIAERYMRGQPPSHTLQATALLGEAYLRVANCPGATWDTRAQFFALVAKAMRSILVDHARARRRGKRAAEGSRVPLDALVIAFEERAFDLLALDAALERLADMDPGAARVVDLRFFCGLSIEEIATCVGTSERTVNRDWRAARAWLLGELS
jgi:RNA polymerase sigma factor (TIGR02999 family)